MNYYVHHTPGRLRVRTPVIWKREYKALAAERLYAGFDGVYLVRASALTGSVVVHFDPEIVSVEAVAGRLVEASYLPAWGHSEKYLRAVQQSSRAVPLLEEFIATALRSFVGSAVKRSLVTLTLKVF